MNEEKTVIELEGSDTETESESDTAKETNKREKRSKIRNEEKVQTIQKTNDDSENCDKSSDDVQDKNEDFSSLLLRAALLTEMNSPKTSPKTNISYPKKPHMKQLIEAAAGLAAIQPTSGIDRNRNSHLSQKELGKRKYNVISVKPQKSLKLALPNYRYTYNTKDTQSSQKSSLIFFRWVQCDNPRCLKWRRLPNDVDYELLKGKWTCKLNKWDSKHSSCDVPEEIFSFGEKVSMQKDIDGKSFEAKKSHFYSTLKHFLAEFGTPLARNPTLGGKDLDLFRLYQEVTERGGCDEVVSTEGTWARIFRNLDNYSSSVTDASYRLKRYYKEYLYAYEQHYFFGKNKSDIIMPISNGRKIGRFPPPQKIVSKNPYSSINATTLLPFSSSSSSSSLEHSNFPYVRVPHSFIVSSESQNSTMNLDSIKDINSISTPISVNSSAMSALSKFLVPAATTLIKLLQEGSISPTELSTLFSNTLSQTPPNNLQSNTVQLQSNGVTNSNINRVPQMTSSLFKNIFPRPPKIDINDIQYYSNNIKNTGELPNESNFPVSNVSDSNQPDR